MTRINPLERTDKIFWSNKEDNLYQFAESYIENGYFHFKKYFSKETVTQLQQVADDSKHNKTFRECVVREINNSDVVRSVFDLHNTYRIVMNLLRSSEISQIAKSILGSEYNIHQSHINFKEARFGGGFDWHSDYTYWHYEDGMPRPRAISIFIILDEVTSENGPLKVIPGSHTKWFERKWVAKKRNHLEFIAHAKDSAPSDPGIFNQDEINFLSQKFQPPVHLLAEPGDMIVMDGNLVHASDDNISPSDRRVFISVLNSVENPLNWVDPEYQRPNYLSDRKNQTQF